MNLNIVWSVFAEKQIDVIFEYYCLMASEKVVIKIVREILNAPNILINNPILGQLKLQLLHRDADYRYLVIRNFKIIYSLDEENRLIKIADVFDTRQNPSKMDKGV